MEYIKSSLYFIIRRPTIYLLDMLCIIYKIKCQYVILVKYFRWYDKQFTYDNRTEYILIKLNWSLVNDRRSRGGRTFRLINKFNMLLNLLINRYVCKHVCNAFPISLKISRTVFRLSTFSHNDDYRRLTRIATEIHNSPISYFEGRVILMCDAFTSPITR